jgi:hypothetical protein
LDICGGFLEKIAYSQVSNMWKVGTRPTSALDFLSEIYQSKFVKDDPYNYTVLFLRPKMLFKGGIVFFWNETYRTNLKKCNFVPPLGQSLDSKFC